MGIPQNNNFDGDFDDQPLDLLFFFPHFSDAHT